MREEKYLEERETNRLEIQEKSEEKREERKKETMEEGEREGTGREVIDDSDEKREVFGRKRSK